MVCILTCLNTVKWF